MSPRHSKAKQAANQQKIVQGTVDGKTQTTIAAEIGVTRETVNRNLAKLREGFQLASKEQFTEYVQSQVALLTELALELWEGHVPPDVGNSIRGVLDSIARLTGSNAPSKSIVGHVTGPQLDALYLEIRQELLDLENDAKQDALLLIREFAKSRKKPVVVDAMPLQPVERRLTDGILRTSD
jgi:hypothetical protein